MVYPGRTKLFLLALVFTFAVSGVGWWYLSATRDEPPVLMEHDASRIDVLVVPPEATKPEPERPDGASQTTEGMPPGAERTITGKARNEAGDQLKLSKVGPPVPASDKAARRKELERNISELEKLMAAQRSKDEAGRANAASFAAESHKIDALVQGSAAVSAPAAVRQGEAFPVYLRVTPDKLAELMRSLRSDYPGNQTVKGKAGIKLTPRMVATVSGFGFDIVPKDGQVQAVSATEATTWDWQVKPLEPGIQTLTVTLSGTLTIEGKEVARNFYHYQQRIEVDVAPFNAGEFVSKNWQWLATSLVLPAVAAAWTVFRKPKDRAGQQMPSLAEKLRKRRRARR